MLQLLTICTVIFVLPILAAPANDQAGNTVGVGSEIFNGVDAEANAWPFMIHISRGGSFICGGTLVRKKWVVTAAHCVDSSGMYAVTVGDHDRTSIEGPEQTIDVKNIIIHPDWDPVTTENDIALLNLDMPADTSVPEIRAMKQLSRKFVDEQLGPDTPCKIIGWGYETDDDGLWRIAPVLQELDITILNNTWCTQKLLGYNHEDTNICYEAPLAAACNGDSGSPVICRTDGKWRLVGVHSFKLTVDGCRGGAKAGTRVSKFRKWIKSYI